MLAFIPKARRLPNAAMVRFPAVATTTVVVPVASSAFTLHATAGPTVCRPSIFAPLKRHMSVGPAGVPPNLPQQLTDAASEVLSDSQLLASNLSSSVLSAVHIAAVLFGDKPGKRGWENFAGDVIQRAGGDRKAVASAFQSKVSSLPVASPRMPSPPVASDAVKVLQRAEELRVQSQDTHVAVDHLFVALVEDSEVGAVIEKATGRSKTDIIALAAPTLRKRKTSSPSADPSVGQSLLSKFGEDLVAKAEAGKLDPVIGRDEEIRRITEILCRRTKCNPVVIGEPGVGKSAVIEGLAQRICAGGGGEPLRGTRIWTLDVGALIAGAKHHGEFEERFKGVLDEVKAADGKIILFIDEVHMLIGAGAHSGAGAANMLKPMLARGELRIIGATTLDEYRKHIEKDEAFARRMQPVYVQEPDIASAISILRGLKRRYEAHHGVTIQDAAVVLAVKLAQRYITGRKLPDSAVDLMDEACARIRVQLDSKPEEIDKLERRELQLKIEATALESEKDSMSQLRLGKVKNELATLREQLNTLHAKLDMEKQRVERLSEGKRKLERLQHELEKANQEMDLETAARLQYGEIPATQKQVEELVQEQERALSSSEGEGSSGSGSGSGGRLVSEAVGPEEIAHVVSRWTGIPVTKLTASDRTRFLSLEHHLHEHVVGQDRAVSAVAQAMLRVRGGLAAPNRPASFLFLGPTGTGKTLLAKSLARELFDDEKHMVRIDCSELSEKHSISKLIGAPPGYVGFDTNAGQLTEAIRRRGHQVVLLDELEKADRSILTVLLQVLDDGRLTDSHGRVVDFSNAIIIMTSNIGAHLMLGDVASHHKAQEKHTLAPETEEAVLTEVQRHFLPEFLNRLDEVVMFQPLAKTQLKDIARKEVHALSARLEDRNIDIRCSEAAVSQLLEEAYDPAYGARPIRRFVDRYIATELSRLIVGGQLPDHTSVLIEPLGASPSLSNPSKRVFTSELSRGVGQFRFILTPKIMGGREDSAEGNEK